MKYEPPKRGCLGIIKVVHKNKKNNFYFLLNACHQIKISEKILLLLFKLTYFYDSDKYNKEIERENFKSVHFGPRNDTFSSLRASYKFSFKIQNSQFCPLINN